MSADTIKRLREALKAHKSKTGKSYRELGEEWDISYVVLARLVDGSRKGLSLGIAVKLAEKLKVGL